MRTQRILALLAAATLAPSLQSAPVPLRLSFNYILNASGNRAATGNINTDEEVTSGNDRANAMFSRLISEFRFQSLGIRDLSGISQWYDILANETERDNLRNAAMGNPSLYNWRNDCINIYISGAWGTTAGAISDFPPNNNIIVICQGSFDNVIPHEVGHSVNLYHTHSTAVGGDDGCSDTLRDDDTWNRDDISMNAFSKVYSQLTSLQQHQVDMVWSNVMSYHNGDTAYELTSCQMDRMSTQCYTDRDWMLTKEPVYIDAAATIPYYGSFGHPYQNIQQAINAGVLNNRVLVLDVGTHNNPSSVISTRTDVAPRKGTATVRDRPPPFILPSTLEKSTNAAVRDAVIKAQVCDRNKDAAGALKNLMEAETAAKGREKQALQLEIAQRLRDARRPVEAETWFRKVADGADQPELRKHALGRADLMKGEAEKQRQKKEAPKPTETEK